VDPIVPMEPKSTKDIPAGDDWVAQVKWDGVRVLLYDDGTTVRLFNRKLRDRTQHYPELQDIHSFCNARSVILDGEIIALGEHGKPDFHQVMKRDGLRRMERVKLVQQTVPILYMVFDVLFHNGEWCTSNAWRDRDIRLHTILTTHPTVHLVPSHEAGQALFNAVQAQGLEGIVLKDKHSMYKIGEKTGDWLKLKNVMDLIAVIGGYTLDGSVANALLLGLFDSGGRFSYICHAGTGRLSKADWVALTAKLRRITTATCPFAALPSRTGHAHWVMPIVPVKIQYMDWKLGKSLRQPSILGFPDILAAQCVYSLEMQR